MRGKLLSVMVVVVLVASGCGSSGTATTAPTAPTATGGTPATAAPSAAPASSAAAAPSQLRFAWFHEFPANWHPAAQAAGGQQIVFSMIYDTLVRRGPDETTLIPDLADSWDVSADGLTYTFHLHKGVTWQDGQPFTAKDVVFTITQTAQFIDAYHGYAPSLWTSVLGAAEIKGTSNPLKGVEALDDSTVKITLAAPNATFVKRTADAVYSIMPEHLLKDATADTLEKLPFSTTSPIGTGPYKFVKNVQDQALELVAYPDYFKGKAKIDKIFLKYIKAETAAAQLQTGEIDLAMDIPESERPQIEALTNVNPITVNGVGTQYLEFRVTNPRVADKRVRQAIYYAVDRRAMLEKLFGNHGRILTVPAGFDPATPGLNQYEYNPEKAKQLLKDANFDFNAPFRVLTIKEESGWPEIAAATVQYLHDIGITNIKTIELDGAGWEALYAKEPAEFDLTLQCCGSEGLGAYVTQTYFNCKKPTSTRYANCDLENLFNEALATTDAAKQKDLYGQAAKILNEDVPYVWLWAVANFSAASKKMGGSFVLYPNARDSFMQIATWEIAP